MPRILLVEDNEMNRDMLSRRLRRRGYTVSIATDGPQGLASAIVSSPDLILMDLSLPSIDGWEATRRLKADPLTRSIPVIALTAHAMAGDRERAFEAGCDDYDMKPIDFARLLGKIEAILATPDRPAAREVASEEAGSLVNRGLLRHDLIGPLVRIIGYCELLEEDALALGRPEQVESFRAIRSTAHEIRRTIDAYLINPPEPGQPLDLEALVASVLTPSHGIIHAADSLKHDVSPTPDRDGFLEDLERIRDDALLLVRMVWQISAERVKAN
jgi:CheY-like chemotaxis protein